ncbi:MAG TPA: ATP-binding protein [Geminicoccaceae bacterium]
MEQVLVNLLGNALDALRDREGGRIEVSAGRDGGGRVVISVRDDGPGVPPELLPRLFEPFFTTKQTGSGLGLGLTISEGIVGEFGGTLRARNRPAGEGGGAEFVVALPEAALAGGGDA